MQFLIISLLFTENYIFKTLISDLPYYLLVVDAPRQNCNDLQLYNQPGFKPLFSQAKYIGHIKTRRG